MRWFLVVLSLATACSSSHEPEPVDLSGYRWRELDGGTCGAFEWYEAAPGCHELGVMRGPEGVKRSGVAECPNGARWEWSLDVDDAGIWTGTNLATMRGCSSQYELVPR